MATVIQITPVTYGRSPITGSQSPYPFGLAISPSLINSLYGIRRLNTVALRNAMYRGMYR